MMPVLDRTQAPEARSISGFSPARVQTRLLKQGVPLHLFYMESPSIVRVEFHFRSGSWNEPSPGLASLTTRLLQEGTRSYPGSELAEKIALQGAWLEVSSGYHKCSVTLYLRPEKTPSVWPYVVSLLTEPSFEEKSWDMLYQNTLQQLSIEQEKPSWNAQKQIRMHYHGSSPYGQTLTPERLSETGLASVASFFRQWFIREHLEIYLTGTWNEEMIAALSSVADQIPSGTAQADRAIPHPVPDSGLHTYPFEKAVQASLRMMMPAPGRNDPAYASYMVMQTMLGGYFGSRLMKNLREEKGYTYGISSQASHPGKTSFLSIASEVKRADAQQAYQSVLDEITKLQQELAPVEELDRVRQYLLGNLQSSLSNPLQVADLWKSLQTAGISYSTYESTLKNLETVTAEDVQKMAQKWLASEATAVLLGA